MHCVTDVQPAALNSSHCPAVRLQHPLSTFALHCLCCACCLLLPLLLLQWMAACDTIITKAGPGTIAEALISGLPILLNGNVPCQVRRHSPFGACCCCCGAWLWVKAVRADDKCFRLGARVR